MQDVGLGQNGEVVLDPVGVNDLAVVKNHLFNLVGRHRPQCNGLAGRRVAVDPGVSVAAQVMIHHHGAPKIHRGHAGVGGVVEEAVQAGRASEDFLAVAVGLVRKKWQGGDRVGPALDAAPYRGNLQRAVDLDVRNAIDQHQRRLLALLASGLG